MKKEKYVAKTTATKKVVKNKTTKISRTKAVELINKSNGKWMQIHSNTKNGAANIMNCVKPKGKPTALGYILVTERGQGTKTFDPRTLRELKVNKNHYIVK